MNEQQKKSIWIGAAITSLIILFLLWNKKNINQISGDVFTDVNLPGFTLPDRSINITFENLYKPISSCGCSIFNPYSGPFSYYEIKPVERSNLG